MQQKSLDARKEGSRKGRRGSSREANRVTVGTYQGREIYIRLNCVQGSWNDDECKGEGAEHDVAN